MNEINHFAERCALEAWDNAVHDYRFAPWFDDYCTNHWIYLAESVLGLPKDQIETPSNTAMPKGGSRFQ